MITEHPFDLEILIKDDLVFLHQLALELMVKSLSGLTYFFVCPSYFLSGFLIVIRALLLTR